MNARRLATRVPALLCIGAVAAMATVAARAAVAAEGTVMAVPTVPTLAGTATIATAVTATAANDFDEVMTLLAARRHGRVEYVEQQFLAVLDHPLESSGELHYDAPDRLEKRTLLPRKETLVLAGGELTIERGARRRVVDLHRYPQVLPFVESIRATLAGDRRALEQVFHVEFTGSVQRWSLSLVPLDQHLLRTIRQVQIDGARDELRRVEIRQADGDRSLMTLRTPSVP